MTIWAIPPGKTVREALAAQLKDQLLYPDHDKNSFLNVLYDVREAILKNEDPDGELPVFLDTKKSMTRAAREGSVTWDPPIRDLAKAIFAAAREE
jgi:hypothetical protein